MALETVADFLRAAQKADAAGDDEAALELRNAARQMVDLPPEAPSFAPPQSGFAPALKSGISGLKQAGYALAGRLGAMEIGRAHV